MVKNPYEQNTAKWWLWDKIESKKSYIVSQRADIERAEKNICEAQTHLDKIEVELADILKGEELIKATENV